MDVQCERCRTEYEFDDALVSARGTTVKCTNCGFQFKIRPPGATAEAERWVVDTVGGQRLVFTTLRELQKAITRAQVGRGDTLTRGNAPPRPLGAIAELEPFFTEAASAAPRPGAAAISRDGSSATAASFPRRPPQIDFEGPKVSPLAATVGVSQPDPPTRAVRTSPEDLPPPRPRADTLRPPDEGAAVPPPAAAHLDKMTNDSVPGAPIVDVEPRRPTAHAAPPPPPNLHPPFVTAPTALSVGPAPAQPPYQPPPPPPVRRYVVDDVDASDPMRMPMHSVSESDAMYPVVPRSRRVGGWVVAVIVLSGACVIGYYAFRPYLAGLGKGAPSAVALDPRAQQFLADGEHALGEGDLDTARSSFDKASALAEKDPHVLLDVARLDAVRADIPWLKVRLLPPDAQDDIKAAKKELDDLASVGRKAADDALAAAPEDPAAVRAKVDALRIIGEREAARSYVAKIIGTAAQHETAYVLAALDLSEIDPLWPTVIDRLRIAAAGEGNAGRARSALVYALARSGDMAGAKAELDKLSALPHPPPLTGALRAFVSKAPTAQADAGPVAVASAKPASGGGAVVDINSLPKDPGSGLSSDPRQLLTQAETAKEHRDFDRAKMLYETALQKSPGDSQALAGLGDVAVAQHDSGSAKGFYQRALAANPNYLPALIGLSDVEWGEGDTARAQKGYKDIVDRFPPDAYPARVRQRAEGGSSSPSSGGGAGQPLTVPSNTPSDLPGTQ